MMNRFPLPGCAKKQDGCFVLRDNNGQALSNIYIEDERKHHLFTSEETAAPHLAA